MDAVVAKWVMGLLGSVLAVAATAGGLAVMVRRNRQDIAKLDDEFGACRGAGQREMRRLGVSVARVEAKLDLLLEHNGLGKRKREG